MRDSKMIRQFFTLLLVVLYVSSISEATVLGRLPIQRIKRSGYDGYGGREDRDNSAYSGHQPVAKIGYQPGYQSGYQPGYQPGHQLGYQPGIHRESQPGHNLGVQPLQPDHYGNEHHGRPIGGHDYGRFPEYGSRGYDRDHGINKGHNYGGHDGVKGKFHEHRYRRSPHHTPDHGEPGHEHDPGHGEPGHIHDPGHGEPGHVHDPGHGEPGHVHDPGHGEPGHVHDPGHGEPGHVHKHDHGPNHNSDESKSSEETNSESKS